jgi:hypothetical protein
VITLRSSRLKRALAKQRDALEDLESALLEFEEAVEGEVPERPESGDFSRAWR